MNNPVGLLLVSIFLQGALWIFLVPLWHFPDEQAHFGQVAFFSETGRPYGKGDENDLTREIYISEEILGTLRDSLGKNKFTHHPEYRIAYSDSSVGVHETAIARLVSSSDARDFVHKEATRYPFLYYIPAGLVSRLFSSSDLFTRVFLVRFWSLFLYVLSIFVVYRIGSIFFTNSISALSLAALVGFQPMMTFSSVGVNSDALGNLLFFLFLLVCLRLLLLPFRVFTVFLLISTIFLCVMTKPQFSLTVFLSFFVFIMLLSTRVSGKKRFLFSFFLFACVPVVTFFLYFFRISTFSLLVDFLGSFDIWNFLTFSREYTLSHTIREVLPWYWGIYNWLGVTYPRIVHRIITRVLAVSLVGFFLWIFFQIQGKHWRTRQFQAILFLVFSAVVYFFFISLYDWFSWFRGKYPLGVQGRYFFPVIVSHMAVLLVGWRTIFSFFPVVRNWSLRIFVLLMMVLNTYGLYTASHAYYDTTRLSRFLVQASQYKPLFAKAPGLILLFVLYVFSLVFFLRTFLRYEEKTTVPLF